MFRGAEKKDILVVLVEMGQTVDPEERMEEEEYRKRDEEHRTKMENYRKRDEQYRKKEENYRKKVEEPHLVRKQELEFARIDARRKKESET
ncbi:hypothetical protein TNCV_154081 [Trichonephila clavipes]|nr:hypothetical protein TNCV_154081 [Trichonephila clavipes]